jgi:hypothetical protein
VLGTPEAAVRSCVNLFSRLFEVPEDYVACYLDMYYQLRLRSEQGDNAQSAAGTQNPQPPYRTKRTMNDLTPEIEGEVKASPPDDGEAGKEAPPGGTKTERRREEKFLEVLESVNAGAPFCDGRGSRSYGNHNAANAAAEKRRIRERLMQMRKAGLSTPQILKAGNGCITEEQVRAIINARPVPVAVFRVLDGVLETLAGAAPET